MATTFSFDEMVPEEFDFHDNRFGGDGTRYDVLTGEMLSITGMVKFRRSEDRLRRLLAKDDPSVKDVEALENMMDAILRLIVPKLPDERLKKIPFQHKMAFVGWWKDQQPEPTAGEVEAGRRLIPESS